MQCLWGLMVFFEFSCNIFFNFAKVEVASSNLVSRSKKNQGFGYTAGPFSFSNHLISSKTKHDECFTTPGSPFRYKKPLRTRQRPQADRQYKNRISVPYFFIHDPRQQHQPPNQPPETQEILANNFTHSKTFHITYCIYANY